MKTNIVRLWTAIAVLGSGVAGTAAGWRAVDLRCEYRVDPPGLDTRAPRLSWRVESAEPGQGQTAYRVLVASTPDRLDRDEGDRWDSGLVHTNTTTGVVYAGSPLASRQVCWWKVQVRDREGRPSPWSVPARWSMGLLEPGDWRSDWISFRDPSALHTNRDQLHLPPARQYRREFEVLRRPVRATIYATALGIYELHLNGGRVGDALFTPGWSDYGRRVYYQTFDVTPLIQRGTNAWGAIVADGWYAGYVGYGLLVGYGPHQTGRNFYGKTPAWKAQLELEYADGSSEVIGTDTTWTVSDQGPHREADLIMGESYDARRDHPDWAQPGFAASGWEPAVRADANGSTRAVFHDTTGEREIELGFQAPGRVQAYPGPPVRVVEELPAVRQTEPAPGVHLFDLGQNIAGVVRLKVQGPAGTTVRLRHGEMLHPDGRLMTENLRRARATDCYTLRGDPAGEVWSPRFTYHGFQFVELTGLPERPPLEAVTGLVVQSDTPLTSAFECSDPVINRLFRNIVWTQRANFVEIPTDCPQRDERLGWMGDAQVYVRTATYNADVAAFFTKWLDDVEEAQRSFGAYPDYAPYPMAHGEPRKTFGTAWMDAGIICPWTIWQVYDDTRVIERHYDSMARFLEFRIAASSNHLGVSIGNPWGDWLNQGEPTPIAFIDTCYFAASAARMADMAAAIGRPLDARNYRRLVSDIRQAFRRAYVLPDGALRVDTQTAYVLALDFDLLPTELRGPAIARLAAKIEANGGRMATGFLGTKALLPVLSAHGQHDLAVRLLQSRQFPSWAYEVINGATTIWERWDSYTKEDGFGRHNAAMNSFSHYSFGAVGEWIFCSLVGIDTDGPGFRRLRLRPGPPAPRPGSDPAPVHWVKAEYDSPNGRISVAWRRTAATFEYDLTVPPNVTATLELPTSDPEQVTESGQSLPARADLRRGEFRAGRLTLELGSGIYRFRAPMRAGQ